MGPKIVPALFILCLLLVSPAGAELYRYQAADGSEIITDDPNKVPADQRERSRVPVIITPEPELSSPPDDDQKSGAINGRDRRPREPGAVPAKRYKLSREKQESASVPADPAPDPLYATPESTWSVLRDSLIRGDLEKALSCFTPSSADQYRSTFSQLGWEKMEEMGRAMTAIQRIGRDDGRGDGTYRTQKRDLGKDIIYQVRFIRLSGNWKIERF